MPAREILLLGNSRLYDIADEINPDEWPEINTIVADLHDTVLEFRRKYGFGRAIAAPQIGIKKRLVYLLTERPVAFINPILRFPDYETMEIWDNCMSFPDLMVRVRRFRRAEIEYRDRDWNPSALKLEGDMSELLQHECDHLDGILAVDRAIDSRSFMLRSEYLRLSE